MRRFQIVVTCEHCHESVIFRNRENIIEAAKAWLENHLEERHPAQPTSMGT